MTKFRIKALELISKADLVNQLYEFLDVVVNYSTYKTYKFASLRIIEHGESVYFQGCSDSNLKSLDEMIKAVDDILLDSKEVI